MGEEEGRGRAAGGAGGVGGGGVDRSCKGIRRKGLQMGWVAGTLQRKWRGSQCSEGEEKWWGEEGETSKTGVRKRFPHNVPAPVLLHQLAARAEIGMGEGGAGSRAGCPTTPPAERGIQTEAETKGTEA